MKDKLKIQIIGWLLLIISLLISGSMIGYDLTEEPTLVAQKINNPFNILGVYIGFYLMKLGFGYAALMIPMILATISFYLISNFSFNLWRLLRFEVLLLILLSVTLGFISNLSYLSEFKEVQNYENSGLLGGLLLSLIYDWTGFYGSVLILLSSLSLFLVSFLACQGTCLLSGLKPSSLRLEQVALKCLKLGSKQAIFCVHQSIFSCIFYIIKNSVIK